MQSGEWLSQQSGFITRFTENMEAIQFLIDHELDILGIELGNEIYAFDMVKDDDLSEFPYDCNDTLINDSISQNFYMPVGALLQGMLKYAIVASIYSKFIQDTWSFPTGVVINPNKYDVTATPNEASGEQLYSFSLMDRERATAKYHRIWNHYFGQLNFYDAVIPHIYMPGLPNCNYIGDIGIDSLVAYGKEFTQFYFDSVLVWQIDRISEMMDGKPLWITEWNISNAYMFSKHLFTCGLYFSIFKCTL